MTIDDKIRDEKLQYDINRQGPKKLALSSGKIEKYGHLKGENILPVMKTEWYSKLSLLIFL